jgi:hypothetical protein
VSSGADFSGGDVNQYGCCVSEAFGVGAREEIGDAFLEGALFGRIERGFDDEVVRMFP